MKSKEEAPQGLSFCLVGITWPIIDPLTKENPMTILISPLTELHLVTAEEEIGERFVDSFRKFLLNNRFAVIDDDFVLSGPQILSLETVERNYKAEGTAPGGFIFASRI